MLAHLNATLEPQIVETYKFLKDLLTLDEMRKLLMMENNQGFRPLEHAAHLATIELFESIMETDGE